MRNLVENEIIEYLETDLLNDGDFLSFEWILNEKKLKFMYISTSKADGFHFVFDIIYSQRTKTLTYLPTKSSLSSKYFTTRYLDSLSKFFHPY